jgi:signal transduction histidine kinase
MQGILDEFLNYSRPLVPLSLGEHDLSALAREVGALHEGLCDLTAVRLELTAVGPAPVQCDQRKVKQIVVNLLQNALEATPRGGKVQLTVQRTSEGVELTVDDEGLGLQGGVTADGAFELGVTTKPRGSGLGLGVARGLARQHGGEVTLTPRAAGGCRATLQLPCHPGATPAEDRASAGDGPGGANP